MLTEEEEQRLKSFLIASDSDLRRDFTYSEHFVKEIRWLSSKLKETNDTLKELEEEVAKQLGLREINKRCNCVGPSHLNSCSEWELPV